MNFNTFITRLDEVALQEIIGKTASNILNMMDTDLTRLSKLQAVILNIYSPLELFQNKEIRNLLFDTLKPPESQQLAQKLNNGNEVPDSYDFLKKHKFRNEADFIQLFIFFELPFPDKEIGTPFIQEQTLVTNYPLFKHQRRAIHSLDQLLYHGNKRVLLHMPTGAGKTRTAMNIICNHFRLHEPTTVIWFANTEELCEQAFEEFERAWKLLGDRELKTIRFWGESTVNISDIKDGFIIAGLAKTYNLLNTSAAAISKLAANCTLTVMDEAHMAVAPTYRLILNTILSFNCSLLGLSATPGRTWNDPAADAELAIFFSKRKVTLEIEGYTNPVEYLVDNGYLAKVNNFPLLYNNGFTISDKDYEYLKDYLSLPDKFLKWIIQ